MPRRNVDVFGGILETSEDELESAGVRVNRETIEGPSQKGSKPKKRTRPAAGSSPETPRPKVRKDEFEFPAEGSYLVEDDTPLMHEDQVPKNSSQLPTRTLDNFFIFESESHSLVPFTHLCEGEGPYEAFGSVLPNVQSSDEDDEDSEKKNKIPFRTTVILRFVPVVFQEEIMIQTEYAVYVLATPSPFYRNLYLPFYRKEKILRLVVEMIDEDPESSAAEFFDSIEDYEDPILEKPWTAEDIVPEIKYSREELKQVLQPRPNIHWDSIKSAPLLELIIAKNDPDQRRSALSVPATPVRPARPPPIPQASKKTRVPPCWETTITPLIHFFIADHFSIPFKVVGEWPTTLKKKLFLRKRPLNSLYGEDYTPVAGDFVLVNREGDRHSSGSETEDDDTDPPKYSIAQIIHAYSKKKFHVRWFVHGSETLLEELAHGQELFLSVADSCEDISMEKFVAKCKVARISLEEHSRQKWPEKDTYFYCAAWDRKNPAGFIEVTDDQVAVNECHECDRSGRPISKMAKDGAIVHGVEYHPRDFIRYKVKDGIVCSFGQVNRIIHPQNDNEILFEVFQIGRLKDRFGSDQFSEMALFITSSTKFIRAVDILGHVRILHTSNYQQQVIVDPEWIYHNPFVFYMGSKASDLNGRISSLALEEFQACNMCMESNSIREFEWSVCRGSRVLRALDPYIGVGGFGLGLAEGCSMKTVFGVDKNPSAAETARINLSPDAKILTNDACRIFAKIVNETLDPGNIDLIYSGPPCQNDSALNQHKSDPTRPIFTTLAFVESLRPEFLVLECVLGFLQMKTVKNVNGRNEREKNAGELKLTLKILHFLGYNVSSRIMYAAAYGVPQTRPRFFIVANVPFYGAFKFPEPTHGFRTSKGQKDPVAQLLPRPARRRKLNDTLTLPVDLGLGTGLLETPTVEDTLSDLPYFDWKLPNSDNKGRPRARVSEVIVGPKKALWGIKDTKFAYTKPCVNSYQYRLRYGIGPILQPSYQHFTKHFPSSKVTNVIDLPIVDGADYRHLEQQNLEWGLRDPASSRAAARHQGHAYTRLVPSGYFDTIVTLVGPNNKQAKIIHPYCKRILTIREFARAQGFPDSFAFYSEKDKVTDIGNSVPFGVSAAIGRAIQELIFIKWSEDKD